MSKITSYTGHICKEHDYRENPIHQSVHLDEMREICKQEIERIVPSLCKQLFHESINNLVEAITYDINTILTLSFNDCEEMFRSEKARQFVSNKIKQEIQSRIDNVVLTINI